MILEKKIHKNLGMLRYLQSLIQFNVFLQSFNGSIK